MVSGYLDEAKQAVEPMLPAQQPAQNKLVDWLKDFSGTPSDASLNFYKEAGRLLKVEADEITAEAMKSVQDIAMQAGYKGGKPLPVYVDTDDTNAKGAGQFAQTSDGTPYIILNIEKFGEIDKWTPEFVRDHVMLTDQDLEKTNPNGSKKFIQLDGGNFVDGFYKDYEKMAEAKGAGGVPIYLEKGNDSPVPQALAGMTKEGKNYIIINTAALKDFSPEQLMAVLEHELNHIENKDITPDTEARAHNDPALAPLMERLADKVSNPEALKEALEIIDGLTMQRFMKENPGVSEEQYHKVLRENDLAHPPIEEREQYLSPLHTPDAKTPAQNQAQIRHPG